MVLIKAIQLLVVLSCVASEAVGVLGLHPDIARMCELPFVGLAPKVGQGSLAA